MSTPLLDLRGAAGGRTPPDWYCEMCSFAQSHGAHTSAGRMRSLILHIASASSLEYKVHNAFGQ